MTSFAFAIVYSESKQIIKMKILFEMLFIYSMSKIFNSDKEKCNGYNSERQDVEEGNMNELVNLCTHWENFYLITRNDKEKDGHVGG